MQNLFRFFPCGAEVNFLNYLTRIFTFFHIYKKSDKNNSSLWVLGLISVDFFEHTTSFIHLPYNAYMVITTHMIHQMTLELKDKKSLETISEITQKEILDTFLKNSDETGNSQKEVISSHS